MMIVLWTHLFVSTNRNRGHTRSNSSGEGAKEAAPNDSRASRDRGRDVFAERFGIEGRAANANQLFYWRKLYREGRLGGGAAAPLLPVKVSEERPAEAAKCDSPTLRSGTMEIKVSKGTIRIVGAIDVVTLRTVLECLAR